MRNYNFVPVLCSDGVVEFVDIMSLQEGLVDALKESEISCGPGYYYDQYVEKYM